MTALAANNTDRFFFHYVTAQGGHTMQVRTQTGVDDGTVSYALGSYLTILTSLFAECNGVSMDFQAAGDSFSTPVVEGFWSTFTWGSGTASIKDNTAFTGAQGRSSGGHRVRLDTFGYKGDMTDYRISNADNAIIDDAVFVLNNTSGCFLAIDGLAPQWYQYLNIKANDYWVKLARP